MLQQQTLDHTAATTSAPSSPSRLMTNGETAAYLGVHPKSLVRARVYGGPLSALPHVKIGRGVRYRSDAIERFIALNTANTVHQQRFG